MMAFCLVFNLFEESELLDKKVKNQPTPLKKERVQRDLTPPYIALINSLTLLQVVGSVSSLSSFV
jgi:regulatory protein YycI of two-component signal transduction system YycFG